MGKIDFTDFVMFAQHYGASYGDENYVVTYDLNHDGEIDFEDYTAFAAEFGTLTHSDKPAGVKGDDELRALALEEAAKEYRTAGNYAQAVIAYRRMIELSDHSEHRARGMRNLGSVYVEIDSLDQAAAQYKTLLTSYAESTDRGVKFQLLLTTVQMARIQLLQNKDQTASQYLSVARTYIPDLNLGNQ